MLRKVLKRAAALVAALGFLIVFGLIGAQDFRDDVERAQVDANITARGLSRQANR